LVIVVRIGPDGWVVFSNVDAALVGWANKPRLGFLLVCVLVLQLDWWLGHAGTWLGSAKLLGFVDEVMDGRGGKFGLLRVLMSRVDLCVLTR